jgi:hypothetical protein
MSSIYTQTGQNLVDIALQYYGDARGLLLLLRDNPTLNLQGKLPAGTVLHIRPGGAPQLEPGMDRATTVAQFNRERGHRPANGTFRGRGINYMRIRNADTPGVDGDFVVSGYDPESGIGIGYDAIEIEFTIA